MTRKNRIRSVLSITMDAFCEAAEAEIRRLARLRDAPPLPKRAKKVKPPVLPPDAPLGLVRWWQAKTLRSSGLTLRQIADHLQVSRQRIHQMLRSPAPLPPTAPRRRKR